MNKYPSQTPEANRLRQQKFIIGKKRLHMNLNPQVFDLFKQYAENGGFTLAEALEKLLKNKGGGIIMRECEYITINKLKSIGARETLIDFFWKNYRNGAFYEYDLVKEILSYNYYDFYWMIKIFRFPDRG